MHIEIQTGLRIRTNADLDGEVLTVTRITVETEGPDWGTGPPAGAPGQPIHPSPATRGSEHQRKEGAGRMRLIAS